MMTGATSFKPDIFRLLLGFAVAPLAAGVLFSLIETGDLTDLPAVLIYGCYPATIVLGIPAYFLLKNFIQPHLIPIVLAGGVIASVPWFLLMLLPGASHAEVGNCVTTVNGRTTWCGYIEGFKLLAEIFAFGAFGGLMFWFCVVWRANNSENQSVADV